MSRPFGVTLIAALLLVALALVAAEALWSLRSYAFVAFVAWGLCAMVALAHHRLRAPGGAHFGGVITGLVYAGLVFAAAAIYLRRAV